MKLLIFFVTSTVILQYQIETVRSRHVQTNALSSLLAALKIQNLPMELDKYRIIEKINEGTYGVVVSATHIPTNETVAIKIIDKNEVKQKSDDIEMLKNEVKVMELANHPNIVKLFHAVDTDNKLYLVMEYAPDGDMAHYVVVHRKLSEKIARAYFREIVSSVEYLHRKNIVHRDLKLQNLILDDNLNTKVADFGYSLICEPDSKINVFRGTPRYRSPDSFDADYDGRKYDVWTLGIILYTFLTKSIPFYHDEDQETFKLICAGEYSISPVPVGCQDLIKKMLEMDPKKRFSSKEIMEHPWMNIGYENNKLKPYNETNLDEKHQNEIKEDLMKKGYKIKDIEASLRNIKYDNHVYAAYLILERKRINADFINTGEPVWV